MVAIYNSAKRPDFMPRFGDPVKSSDLNQIADYLRKQLFVTNGPSVVFSFWGDADILKNVTESPPVHVVISADRGSDTTQEKRNCVLIQSQCLNNGMSFNNTYRAANIAATITTPRSQDESGGSLPLGTHTGDEKQSAGIRLPCFEIGALKAFKRPSVVSMYYDSVVFAFSGNPGDARVDFLPPETL